MPYSHVGLSVNRSNKVITKVGVDLEREVLRVRSAPHQIRVRKDPALLVGPMMLVLNRIDYHHIKHLEHDLFQNRLHTSTFVSLQPIAHLGACSDLLLV